LIRAAGVALLLGATLYVALHLYYRWFSQPVVSNALVGQTEAQITRKYGKPDHDEPGYSALGLGRPTQLPPDPIRTVIFHPGGLLHPERGTLWVWYKLVGEEWVCFESCWYADGVQF
jgi:hypothetical protein